MPVCVVCGNRPFAIKEALQQHLRTSSNPHPFCLPCDRRFVSESAYNAHMAAKHPPTFDCLKCNKQYNAQFALEDHYRGHTAHPNCTVCGRGFYDNSALDVHIRDAHIDLRCDACNLKFESIGAANEHYTRSPAHPKCESCAIGFRDFQALEKHMGGPPHAPEPTEVNGTGTLQNIVTGEVETPTGHSPPLTLSSKLLQGPPTSVFSTMALSPPLASSLRKDPSILQPTATQAFTSTSSLSLVGSGVQPGRNSSATSYGGTGFSPLSPKPHIFNKDLRRVATIDTTVRADSPDLPQMINAQGSPLLNVQAPIFSPVALPKPGKQIDQLWSSRENVQVPQNRIPRLPSIPAPVPGATTQTWSATPVGSANSGAAASQQIVPYTNNRYQAVPPRHRAGSDFGTTSPVENLPTTNGFTRHTSSISEPRYTLRTDYNFNPRLYPGIARHAASRANTSLPNSQTAVSIHRGNSSNAGNSLGSPYSVSSTSPPARLSYNSPFDIGLGHFPTSLLSLPLPPETTPINHQDNTIFDSPHPSSRQDSEDDDTWKDMGSDILDYATDIMEEDRRQNQSFKDEISILSAVSTPRLASDVPLHEFGVKPETNENLNGGGGLLPSPSDFSSISSVSSSVPRTSSPTPVVGRERMQSRSRSRGTSSARSDISDISSLSIPTYRITASSELATPISPDVISPVGLAALPVISPLPHTPIEIDGSFDIPEARQPLPDSIPPSPITVRESSENELQAQLGETEAENMSNSDAGVHEDWGVFLVPELASMGSSDKHTHDHADVEPKSPSSPSSPQSFMTSQEPSTDDQEAPKMESDEDHTRRPSRAASVRTPLNPVVIEDLNRCITPDLIVKSPSPSPLLVTPKDETAFTLPRSTVHAPNGHPVTSPKRQQHLIAPPLGPTPNISIASTCPSEGTGGGGVSPGLPLLHCRACRRETPDDITATMCGHVFCNRCITDAVIKTSRCPLCSTPTLLYCLFRLDLTT